MSDTKNLEDISFANDFCAELKILQNERDYTSYPRSFTCDKQYRPSGMHLQVQCYLKTKKISELFNFLIAHLLVEEPADPIEYLEKLLQECVLYRAGVREPPLLFQPRHIRSIFESLGPDNLETISLEGYNTGMITLGLCDYNVHPDECIPGRVDWKTFEKESRKCLDKLLNEMIGKTHTSKKKELKKESTN